jgi:FMN-dependent NADH-azoreductase
MLAQPEPTRSGRSAPTILHVDSSITGEQSITRQLSAAIVNRLLAVLPNARVERLDLTLQPVDHLSHEVIAARQLDGVKPQQRVIEAMAADAAILEQFLAAELIVIGAPMYNFGVPSSLKAWLDRLAVAGKTFRYTEAGPAGLAGDKRVFIGSARGNVYDAHRVLTLDHQERYLQAFFGFLGITDPLFFRAEGTGIGPDHRRHALEHALASITELNL